MDRRATRRFFNAVNQEARAVAQAGASRAKVAAILARADEATTNAEQAARPIARAASEG